MKLYVCYGTFQTPLPGGHACANAHRALRDAGHDPQVVRSYGAGFLPDAFNRTAGRRRAKELTGNAWVPVLETDEGEAVAGSKNIIAWAQANPKGA